LLSEDYTKH